MDFFKRYQKWVHLASAVIFTIIWLGLTPILFGMASMGFMIFDGPGVPLVMGYLTIFFLFLIPLSCLISIFCIWFCYFYNRIPLMYYSSFIPIITMLFVFLIDSLIITLISHLR